MGKITISFNGDQGQEAYHEAEADYEFYAILDQLLYRLGKSLSEESMNRSNEKDQDE